MDHIKKASLFVGALLCATHTSAIPADPQYFHNQLVDHFGAGGETYVQR